MVLLFFVLLYTCVCVRMDQVNLQTFQGYYVNNIYESEDCMSVRMVLCACMCVCGCAFVCVGGGWRGGVEVMWTV